MAPAMTSVAMTAEYLETIQPVSSNIETYKRGNKKIGRNEPCGCGSGKKNKKCCNTK